MKGSDVERIAGLENESQNMAKIIESIQRDVKEIRSDITDLRVSFAKWSTGIVVAVTVIQAIIQIVIVFI